MALEDRCVCCKVAFFNFIELFGSGENISVTGIVANFAFLIVVILSTCSLFKDCFSSVQLNGSGI